jgi:hypothetical protein
MDEEPITVTNTEEQTSTPPIIAQPTRVDSGIEVESPAEGRSAVEVAQPHMAVEDPVVEDAPVEEPTGEIATKEPTVENSAMEEPAPEPKFHMDKPTVDEPAVEAKPAPEEAPEEFEDAMDEPAEEDSVAQEPTEEDHFLDATDEPVISDQPASKVEPTVTSPLAEEVAVKGEPLEESPVTGEPTAAPRIEKELHVNVNPAMKEQHTRVDSGIDVETPMREAPGKLEPLVEVRPGIEIDAGLEGGIA